MVIDPNNIANTASAGAKNKAPSSESAAAVTKSNSEKPSSNASSDSVSLSAEAQSLGKLESSIAAEPEVDAAKVASIRNAIQSGQYQVNAEQIADKIIRQDSLV